MSGAKGERVSGARVMIQEGGPTLLMGAGARARLARQHQRRAFRARWQQTQGRGNLTVERRCASGEGLGTRQCGRSGRLTSFCLQVCPRTRDQLRQAPATHRTTGNTIFKRACKLEWYTTTTKIWPGTRGMGDGNGMQGGKPGICQAFADGKHALTVSEANHAEICMPPAIVWMMEVSWRPEIPGRPVELRLTNDTDEDCERVDKTRSQSRRTGARQRADEGVASPVDRARSRGSEKCIRMHAHFFSAAALPVYLHAPFAGAKCERDGTLRPPTQYRVRCRCYAS